MEYTAKIETLRDFLRVLYRHRFITLIIFIVVMPTIYIGQQMRTPQYEASVRILVTGSMPKDIDYERSLGPGSLVETQRELVTSKKVIERAARAMRLYERPLDYEKRYAPRLRAFLIEKEIKRTEEILENMSPEQRESFHFGRAVSILSNSISTSPIVGEETSIFLIKARDFSPQEAVRMANVVSRSYVIFDLETQIAELQLMYGERNVTIQKLQSHIEKLLESLDGRMLSDFEALGPASVKIISQAGGASLIRTRGDSGKFYIFGVILSILLGIVFSLGFEYIDQRVKGPKDIDRYFKIPFLGSIPKRKKKDMLIMNTPSASDKLECIRAFQNVGDRVSLFVKENGVKSILVNSFTKPLDSSSVTANLGIYLARDTGKKILIVDGNLGFSSVSAILGINSNPDIVDVFEGKCALKEAIKDVGNNLYLLPSRPVQFRPIKLMDSPFMANLIKGLEDEYDLILVDCQLNLLKDTSPVVLSSYVDAVMMVLSEGEDRYYQVELGLNILRQRNGVKIFSVLNNRKKDLPKILERMS